MAPRDHGVEREADVRPRRRLNNRSRPRRCAKKTSPSHRHEPSRRGPRKAERPGSRAAATSRPRRPPPKPVSDRLLDIASFRDGCREPHSQPLTHHGKPVRTLTLGAMRGVPAEGVGQDDRLGRRGRPSPANGRLVEEAVRLLRVRILSCFRLPISAISLGRIARERVDHSVRRSRSGGDLTRRRRAALNERRERALTAAVQRPAALVRLTRKRSRRR